MDNQPPVPEQPLQEGAPSTPQPVEPQAIVISPAENAPAPSVGPAVVGSQTNDWQTSADYRQTIRPDLPLAQANTPNTTFDTPLLQKLTLILKIIIGLAVIVFCIGVFTDVLSIKPAPGLPTSGRDYYATARPAVGVAAITGVVATYALVIVGLMRIKRGRSLTISVIVASAISFVVAWPIIGILLLFGGSCIFSLQACYIRGS